MPRVRFVSGPLEGTAIDLGRAPPERVALSLSAAYGGPGVALYDLRVADGVAAYHFSGWQDGRGGDGVVASGR